MMDSSSRHSEENPISVSESEPCNHSMSFLRGLRFLGLHDKNKVNPLSSEQRYDSVT